jgi:hypothetical protein
MSKPDVIVRPEGSVIGFQPMTPRAKKWFKDHVQSDGWQWFGLTLYVDHRMAGDLSDGIDEAGFRRVVV